MEAFDKHWNIALSDVREVWRRKKLHYWSTVDFAAGDDSPERDETDKCASMLRELGIHVPEVKVRSLNRKYVECSRRVDQMLIRGEQVVLITTDPEENAK